jgi:hypothetical protein
VVFKDGINDGGLVGEEKNLILVGVSVGVFDRNDGDSVTQVELLQ